MQNVVHWNRPHQSQCSWNTLITHQIKSGKLAQALNLYQRMPKDDSTHITGHTYVNLLKACTKLQNVEQGLFMHADVARVGLLDGDIFAGNTLIDLYGKLGMLEKARQVFFKLPKRDVVSWTALIAAYVENGHRVEALHFFEVMKQGNVTPNAVTYICTLKACGSLRDINKGREIHDEVERQGLLQDELVVRTALVDMYAKCGSLKIASQVLDKIPVRDVVSWSALVAGCAEHGFAEQAFNYFQQMQIEGVSPVSVTLVSILKACGSSGAIQRGIELHSVAKKEGFVNDLLVANTLIDMYVKLGLLALAQEVFDSIPYRDVVSWTTLMAGYVENEQGQKAVELFEQMDQIGVCPNPITLVFSLKACGFCRAVQKGLKLHSEVERRGLLTDCTALGNALVDMYAKCGLLSCAQQEFEKLQQRDIVSWNALITAYAEHGCGIKALEFFERMQYEGVSPDVVTYVYCLKSCGSIGAIDIGYEIHAMITRQGLLDRELVIGHILIEMYAGCGLLAVAQQVFNKLSSRNAVSWNVLITGYAEHGHGEDTLKCFNKMQLEGVSPSPVTFICSLKACVRLGSTDWGRVLHSKIERQGLFEQDIIVGNSLVSMYAKFGLLERAQELFDKLPVQDVISWNALLTGYAEHGYGTQTLNCFEQMQLHGVWPNILTFICSVKACGTCRDASRGQEIHTGIECYGFREKYPAASNTLVRMYARCGSLTAAQAVFNKVHFHDIVAWASLIASYAEHCYVEEVLHCFLHMSFEGLLPTASAFVSSLKSCGCIKALAHGKNIHTEVKRLCLLDDNPIIGNSLVDMYVKNGQLTRAQEVFDNLLHRDIIAWNTIIAGFAHWGLCEKALTFFNWMQVEGVVPDACTFVSCLKACEAERALNAVEDLNSKIENSSCLEGDMSVAIALIHIYAKCGSLAKAQHIFDDYQFHAIALWNALIKGYTYYEQNFKVLECFELLEVEGTCPDAWTCICNLNACRDLGAISKGKKLHGEIEKKGLLNEVSIGNSIVSMYAKCGHLAEACQVFDVLHVRDVVVWTTLMSGYSKLGQVADVFKVFNKMAGEGTQPDLVSLFVALEASSLLNLLNEKQSYVEAIGKHHGIAQTSDHYLQLLSPLAMESNMMQR